MDISELLFSGIKTDSLDQTRKSKTAREHQDMVANLDHLKVFKRLQSEQEVADSVASQIMRKEILSHDKLLNLIKVEQSDDGNYRSSSKKEQIYVQAILKAMLKSP